MAKKKEKSRKDIDIDEKPRPPFFSSATLSDPSRMSIIQFIIVIVLLLIFFYFGWG